MRDQMCATRESFGHPPMTRLKQKQKRISLLKRNFKEVQNFKPLRYQQNCVRIHFCMAIVNLLKRNDLRWFCCRSLFHFFKKSQPPPNLQRPVKFRSNLLGGFGAGFATPLNTIDFGTLFDNLGQKIIDSAVVWGTIIAIVVIYIPIAVFSCRADGKDVFKVCPNIQYM